MHRAQDYGKESLKVDEQSEFGGRSQGAQHRFKGRLVLSGLIALPIYMAFALFLLVSLDGQVFLTPAIYCGGLVFAMGLSVVLVRVLPGTEENVLLAAFVAFPVVLMLVFPLVCVAPMRLLHTFLPQQEAIEILHFEHLSRCGKRSSSMRGASFEEAFGMFNHRTCDIPSSLVGQLRRGDEMHWLIMRSAVGFSLKRLERVTRNRQVVSDLAR